MKATDILWDADEGDDISGLPTEIEIPDEILNVNKIGKNTSEVFDEQMEIISDYITESTGFCHNGFDIETERKDAVQYALNQGIGILHSTGDGETTKAETERAGNMARYVAKDTVDFFASDDAYVKGSTQYAIISDMSVLDFDEWNDVAEAVGVQLSWEDAAEINEILWENYDFSPMDIEVSENAKTVKEAVLDDLTPEDENAIHSILSKYGSECTLTVSADKEITE